MQLNIALLQLRLVCDEACLLFNHVLLLLPHGRHMLCSIKGRRCICRIRLKSMILIKMRRVRGIPRDCMTQTSFRRIVRETSSNDHAHSIYQNDSWSWDAAKRPCRFWLASVDSARRAVKYHTVHQSAGHMPACHRFVWRVLLILGKLQKDEPRGTVHPRVPTHRQWHGDKLQQTT